MFEKNITNFTGSPENKEKEKQIRFESAAFGIPKEGHLISEDSMLIDDEDMLFGVFDGIGGHAAGEVASKIAAESLKNDASKIEFANGRRATSSAEVAEQLSAKLLSADAKIYEETKKDPSKNKMGTTAAVVKLFASPEGKKVAIIAWAGDSRVYIYSNGKLKKITRDDHSLRELGVTGKELEALEEKLDSVTSAEKLDGIEIVAFKIRNAISNYLGISSGAVIRTSTIELSSGDKIIITSDGIHDDLTTQKIEDIAKEDVHAKDIATKLVQSAKDRSEELDPETGEKHLRAKRDDMSAVVIEIEPKPGKVAREDEITQKIKISH